MSRVSRVLLWAQAVFFLALGVCVTLDPRGLGSNHGWSYYESRGATAAPYVIGFVGTVALVAYAAAIAARSNAPQGLAWGLAGLALFLALDVASPDTVDAVFYWAHDITSAALFLYELGFAVWLVRTLEPTAVGVALVVVQFCGGLVAMFSQLQVISQLGLGILVFQVSFGVLLVTATFDLDHALDDAAVALNPATGTTER